MIEKLSKQARADALKGLPAWRTTPERDAIVRHVQFPDFAAAFAFMTKLALYAEKVNHHPEGANIFNQVTVILTTHDCQGVSAQDIDFAQYMDSLLDAQT